MNTQTQESGYLFDFSKFLFDEHGLIVTDTEMQEIIHQAKKVATQPIAVDAEELDVLKNKVFNAFIAGYANPQLVADELIPFFEDWFSKNKTSFDGYASQPKGSIDSTECISWREECERLAKVAKYWQEEYYKINPTFQPPKLDHL